MDDEFNNAVLTGTSMTGMCVSVNLFLSASYHLHVERTQYQIYQGYLYLFMGYCCLVASCIAFATAVLNKSKKAKRVPYLSEDPPAQHKFNNEP
ncbi:hypothetical protein M8J77_010949 [Diaphorina citri]|nr:hypothetical protein M8J77_010949 [Diaphorina citri]